MTVRSAGLLMTDPLESDSRLLNRNPKLNREAVRAATENQAQPPGAWTAQHHNREQDQTQPNRKETVGP
ncbi:hypothetical protein [Streptomyces sp. NPDC002785]|uniref:hypothetical protein n=1 Tax=Streptomyces sp. NPDC002785 TaxID=3154543 RepID=UPI003320751B